MPKFSARETAHRKSGAAPADFVNASPFRRRKQQGDPVRDGIFIGLAVVMLVFLASMIAVLLMHAPGL
jgi:hypothetical protein